MFPKTKFDTLRYVTCAGGALAKSFIEELQACLPHTEIYIMYGQTEASARLSYLAPIDLPRKIGSIKFDRRKVVRLKVIRLMFGFNPDYLLPIDSGHLAWTIKPDRLLDRHRIHNQLDGQ